MNVKHFCLNFFAHFFCVHSSSFLLFCVHPSSFLLSVHFHFCILRAGFRNNHFCISLFLTPAKPRSSELRGLALIFLISVVRVIHYAYISLLICCLCPPTLPQRLIHLGFTFFSTSLLTLSKDRKRTHFVLYFLVASFSSTALTQHTPRCCCQST